MFATLFRSDSGPTRTNVSALVLRLALAAIFLYHGLDKIANGEGGGAWAAQLQNRVPGTVMPSTLTYSGVQFAVAWCEFIGGLALLVGMFTRLAALIEIGIQIGAVALVTAARGFVFEKGGGYEYNLALLAMCLAVFILGAGRWSLDGQLIRPHHREAAGAGTHPLSGPHVLPSGQPAEPVTPGQPQPH